MPGFRDDSGLLFHPTSSICAFLCSMPRADSSVIAFHLSRRCSRGMLQVSCRIIRSFFSVAELLNLRWWYRLLPMLLYCGKMSNMLTLQMVSASATQLINCIIAETEPSGLVSLFKCFVTSLVAIGGPTALPQELHNSLIEAVKRHLQNFAEERKARAQRPASDYADGFLFMVEIENFALIQMGKLLYFLNPKDPLLGDVWKVQNMGLNPDTTSVDARD